MKKKLLSLLVSALLLAALLPATVQTAFAQDYDRILSYQVDVTPNVNDGSLAIRLIFRWKALEDLPAANSQQGGVKIGIPNGSIRDMTALTDNIDDIQYDNSYAYVDFVHGYDAGEEFTFSFSWVQEYMYRLNGGAVTYDYTPGWFDGILVDEMALTWHDPAGVTGEASDGVTQNGDHVLTASNMDYGDKLSLAVTYSNWPTQLSDDGSADNLPMDNYPDHYYDDSTGDFISSIIGIVIMLIVLFVIVSVLSGVSRYRGGFGTRYVFVNGLWYPRGPGGKPRPGSVGTKTRPQPPRNDSHRGGGFGGGSRGGGFGGGGFGGGSHCACASSCACACACACAGGGRAGCSAKNLYGAIHLDKDASEKMR